MATRRLLLNLHVVNGPLLIRLAHLKGPVPGLATSGLVADFRDEPRIAITGRSSAGASDGNLAAGKIDLLGFQPVERPAERLDVNRRPDRFGSAGIQTVVRAAIPIQDRPYGRFLCGNRAGRCGGARWRDSGRSG